MAGDAFRVTDRILTVQKNRCISIYFFFDRKWYICMLDIAHGFKGQFVILVVIIISRVMISCIVYFQKLQ